MDTIMTVFFIIAGIVNYLETLNNERTNYK